MYGLGGKDFTEADAKNLVNEAVQLLDNPSKVPAFGFVAPRAGEPGKLPPRVLKPITPAEASAP